MQRADSAAREFFLAPAGRGIRICLSIIMLLGFILLCLLKNFSLADTEPLRIGTAVLFAVPFALMLLFLFRAHPDGSPAVLLMGAAVCLLSMLLRLCFIDRNTGDFEYYLNDWLRVLAGQSFSASMRMRVGEYHVLYQYILFLLTRLPLPWLYTVKAVSFIGDACLLGAAFRLADTNGDRARGNRALLVLLLPAIVLNGGMFAQCDSLYTVSLLWGLAFILEGKPARGMACMGLAVCFKLQAVFLFPLLPLLWLAGKIRLRDLIPFLAAVLIVQLPAVIMGKAPTELISIYTGQAAMYTNLNYGTPNLWALLVSDGLDAYAYGTFGIALALALCLLVLCGALRRMDTYGDEDFVGIAALIVLICVFCLPRMHERYTYAAEVLTCIYALRVPRALPAALAISLASLASLLLTTIPLWGGALLMLFAATWLVMMLFGGHEGRSGVSERKWI